MRVPVVGRLCQTPAAIYIWEAACIAGRERESWRTNVEPMRVTQRVRFTVPLEVRDSHN
jgi:hypothetical protein